MLKLSLLSVFVAVCWLQLSLCESSTEASAPELPIDGYLRNRLNIYKEFLAQDESAGGTHKDDLQKLIKLTDNALASKSEDEKRIAVEEFDKKFSAEFNNFINEKLAELQLNGNIVEAMEFYRSLSSDESKINDEIKATVDKLQTILDTADVKEKQEKFVGLEKTFSPELQSFLHENLLRNLNADLKKNQQFFELVLSQKEGKYDSEIKALIEQIKAVLGETTVEEKRSTLYKVSNPEPLELFRYLQKKFNERQ